MARHVSWRRTPPSAGPRTRSLRLEPLEGRDSPSALLFDSFLATPLEAPLALASASVADAELRGPTAAPAGAAGETLAANAWDGDGFVTPAQDLRPDRFVEVRAVDPFAGDTGGGPPMAQSEGQGPAIVGFYASEGKEGWWTFAGRVDADSPGGLIVIFGGLDTLVDQTAPVNDDGTFSLTIQLQRTPVCEEGLATAQTTDWDNQPSNVAEDYVHQTNCPR